MSLTGGVGDDMRKFLEAAQEDAEGHEDRARNGDLKHRWRAWSAILTAKASLSGFFLGLCLPICVNIGVDQKQKGCGELSHTGSDRIS